MSRISTAALMMPSTPPDATWWAELIKAVPIIRYYSQSLNPASVAGTTRSVQTFTVTGLETTDIVILNYTSLLAGLFITGYRVSTKDTLELTFYNTTGGALDQAATTFNIISIRS